MVDVDGRTVKVATVHGVETHTAVEVAHYIAQVVNERPVLDELIAEARLVLDGVLDAGRLGFDLEMSVEHLSMKLKRLAC